MTPEEDQVTAGETTTETVEAEGLLDQAIKFTKKTEPDRAKELVENVVQRALDGTVQWDKNLTLTLNRAIDLIDQKISNQLAQIMHDPKFTKLEGTWRGLQYLVMNTETCRTLKIKALNIGKRELFKDLDKAVEFDQSQTFKKIYTAEFDQPGGEPFGVLIGDYEFTPHPDDIDLLRNMSNVAAAGFSPFISAASPALFGFDSWTELSGPRDLAKIFEAAEYIKWGSYRETPDSRFVSLVMPRVLARLPYGEKTKPIDEFRYEEAPIDEDGIAREAKHDDYCWMNAAYIMGARITDTFAKTNWTTTIRGAESGGKVENLSLHLFTSDEGDTEVKCPSEIAITERRDAELGKLGFIPLCWYKNTDYSVFFGAQTTQQPTVYDRPDATANAAISARLPYIMASSRVAHYLKSMARDWIGSLKEEGDLESLLNRWINNYVNSNPNSSEEERAKRPLRAAVIKVEPIPGKPGSYNAVAHLRPWLQMEELTTSLRLVAEIPKI